MKVATVPFLWTLKLFQVKRTSSFLRQHDTQFFREQKSNSNDPYLSRILPVRQTGRFITFPSETAVFGGPLPQGLRAQPAPVAGRVHSSGKENKYSK